MMNNELLAILHDVDAQRIKPKAAAEKIEALDRWIPVKDELPFPGEKVIATDGIVADLATSDMVNWYSCDSNGISLLSMNNIIAWMPMPPIIKITD